MNVTTQNTPLEWQCHDRSRDVVWHYGKAPLCGAELAEPCRTLTADPKRTVTCPACRRMMEQGGEEMTEQ